MKPSSYFYEPLPLPPEDLEPLPEKPVKYRVINLNLEVQFFAIPTEGRYES